MSDFRMVPEYRGRVRACVFDWAGTFTARRTKLWLCALVVGGMECAWGHSHACMTSAIFRTSSWTALRCAIAPRSTVLPAWLAPLAAKRSVASLPHNAIGHTQALRYPFGTIYQPGHADTRTGRTHNILCTKRSPLIV